jgi:uncharacterized protein
MTTMLTSEEELVAWKVDDIDVNASLTCPTGTGPFPAVIMVAGSGPTDRNWNSPLLPGSNGSAALLARVLTDLGYVTLRYDKRSSGPQGKDNAMRLMGKISMQSHLDELAGGVKLLAGRQDVDSAHIYALTNSEGCFHALNYQIQSSDRPFAGLVLTSAPARSVGAVARSQIEAQLKLVPGGEKWLAAYDVAIANFMAGLPVKIDESLPEGLRLLLLSTTSPVNQPFARELWASEPDVWLSQVRVPILILIGKKDIQVDWQVDGAIFEEAVKGHDNITVAYAENANHVLKYESRDRAQLSAGAVAATYNGAGQVLDKETVDTITSWLVVHR